MNTTSLIYVKHTLVFLHMNPPISQKAKIGKKKKHLDTCCRLVANEFEAPTVHYQFIPINKKYYWHTLQD
jgi:hypothetical protein